MKYASEIIELMSAKPERDFRMVEIIRRINPQASTVKKHSLRTTIIRAVNLLADTGAILIKPATKSGSYALYRWVHKT